MESKEERLLKAIFSENEDSDDNFTETGPIKVGTSITAPKIASFIVTGVSQ